MDHALGIAACVQNNCWFELALHSHLVLGQVCILDGAQDHAQQRLLLLWAQRLQGAPLEAAKHTQVNVAVCQACSHSIRISSGSSGGGRSVQLAIIHGHEFPAAEADENY
jgi:hypothetical protein